MSRLEHNHPLVLAFFFFSILLTFVAILSPRHDASAQVNVTPRSRDRNAEQIQAPDLQATVQARATELQATIESVTSSVERPAGELAATVTAIQAQVDNLSPELQALLNTLSEQGSISFDGDSLNAAVFVSEAQMDALLDVLIEAAGYNPNAAAVDTQADGTIDIVLIDIDGELPGTLVLSYQLTVVDGEVIIDLLGVTLNGHAVPADSLPEELVSAVELAVNAAAVEPMLSAAAVYSVDTLVVTEDGILIAVTVSVAE